MQIEISISENGFSHGGKKEFWKEQATITFQILVLCHVKTIKVVDS